MESLSYFMNAFHNDDDSYGWRVGKGKVSIVKTEDDKLYLWDAHHRVCAAHNAGHVFIPRSEYILTEMTYKKVMSINFNKGYVTPFNLQTECRIPDFMAFKTKILNEFNYGCKMTYEPTYYTSMEMDILLNAKCYKEKRTIYNVEELLNATGLPNS